MSQPHIPAKPTKYKGIQYRSRLEAGWAVFWDTLFAKPYPCPCGCQVSSFTGQYAYEDFTTEHGHDFYGGWVASGQDEASLVHTLNTYRPDFRISSHISSTSTTLSPAPTISTSTWNTGCILYGVISPIFFQEVKPVFPNGEYIKMLRTIQEGIGSRGYTLILTVGGMRDETLPNIYHYPYVESFCLSAPWFRHIGRPIIRHKHILNAYTKAREFRWDLYKE